jgi:prefoldin subunit 5
MAITYVLIHGSSNIMATGGDLNLHAALAKKAEYGSHFIWFQRHGEGYVIRDAATLDQIDHLFDAQRALDPDAERLRDRLRPLEKRESKLDHEIDALEDGDEKLTSDDRQRLRDLQREMRDVEAQLRVLEREEEAIDRKRDAREADAERRMVPILDEAIRSGVAKRAD